MFDLSKTPKKQKEDFAYADFIELHCLAHPDKVATPTDIAGIINESRDINDDADLTNNQDVIENNDNLERVISEKFSHFDSRLCLFGELYPFIYSDNELKLKDNLTIKHKIYIYLLLCSNLRNINNLSFRQTLASTFESFSAHSIENLFKDNAEVHVFGAQNQALGRTASQRMQWLATTLNTTVVADEHEFTGNIAGEKGLDIVAWFNFVDNKTNRPIFLIQCYCGKDDISKKCYQVAPSRWEKIIKFSNTICPVLCIPQVYRRENGDFFSEIEIGNTLIIDRLRLIQYASSLDVVISNQEVMEALQELGIL